MLLQVVQQLPSMKFPVDAVVEDEFQLVECQVVADAPKLGRLEDPNIGMFIVAEVLRTNHLPALSGIAEHGIPPLSTQDIK